MDKIFVLNVKKDINLIIKINVLVLNLDVIMSMEDVHHVEHLLSMLVKDRVVKLMVVGNILWEDVKYVGKGIVLSIILVNYLIVWCLNKVNVYNVILTTSSTHPVYVSQKTNSVKRWINTVPA